MPNLNDNIIQYAYSAVMGREPTADEVGQWKKTDVPKEQQLPYLMDKLSTTPEAQQFTQTKSQWTPFGSNQAGITTGQTISQPETVSQPTGFSPSVNQSFSSGTYTPVSFTTGSDTRTFGTNYQPTVDQNGNVSKFIPGGMSYTPTQYSTYAPSTTSGTSTPGSPTQAFPASSTVSGVNVPSTANSGQYASIPLNSSGLGSMTIGGGTGEGGVAFPTFTFDFAKEQADAYSRLKPFYEKLLSFAGGRLDLAQRILEYTYQQGMRESRQEYEQSAKEQALTFPQEQEQMKTQQNARGIMTSGFGKTEASRLTQSQDLRREAIDRALENRESRLSSQRGFGLEEKQQGFEEEKFGQERERRNESSDLAEKKFSIKQAEYQSELDKALRQEQKNIRQSDRDFQIKLAKGQF